MDDLLRQGLRAAQSAGASYADIRRSSRNTQTIRAENGKLTAVNENADSGIGIRVLKDGAWGFAAAAGTAVDIQTLAARAVKLARASALLQEKPVALAPALPVEGSYQSTVRRDPFAVPLTEKAELVKGLTQERAHPAINHTRAELSFFKETTEFANTEGSRFRQEFTQSGADLTTRAVKSGQTAVRSYPAGLGGDHRAAGYEFIESLDLPAHASAIQREAAELLSAPPAPRGIFDVIIDSSQMALQIHESCGHPLELDRILGTEISLAGGSFVGPADRKRLRYAAPVVNITADATIAGGLGTFGVDDEGTPAARIGLIQDGMLANFLTSRETAAACGLTVNGAMRADGWRYPPLIRMTNINLEPGDWSLDELIRDLKDGILLKTNTSWSIDDLRLNFQFATEIGYLIKNGSIAGIVKNPIYSGRTPDFWNSCDAVGNRAEWRLWGINNCGKGDPLQTMRVSHGTAPARFRKVRMGV